MPIERPTPAPVTRASHTPYPPMPAVYPTSASTAIAIRARTNRHHVGQRSLASGGSSSVALASMDSRQRRKIHTSA